MALPYIYLLTDLRNNKQYIGKTCGRYKSYFSGGSIIKDIISKHGRKVFKKQILIEGTFNNNLLNELEKHYIQLYATNKIGYNLTPGGDNGAKYLSKESRQRINNSKKKEVSLLTLKGEHLKDFSSITDLSLFLNCNINRISKSIHNGLSISGKYKVVNKGDIHSPINNKRYKMIKVFEKGNLLGEFLNPKEISEKLNIGLNSLKKAIPRGQLKKFNLKFETNVEW